MADSIEGNDPVVDPQDPEPQDPTGGDPTPGTVDPEPADPTPADPGDDPTADPQKKGGVEKRIGKLTKEKSEAQREAAYWKGVAEGKTQDIEPDPEPAKPSTELDPNSFETYEEYVQASIKKGVEEGIKEGLKVIKTETEQEKKLQTAQTIQAQYGDARKVHKDFDEIALNPTLPINQTIMDAAMGESFAEILYALGKAPEKAAQISMMTPLQAAREIGKIEERILNPKKPTKKTTTNAPEPIKPLGGGGNADATPIDKMSTKQKLAKWDKERREQSGVK